MKQKATSLLIIMALLAGPLTVAATGRQAWTDDEIKAHAAKAQAKKKEVVVKFWHVSRILIDGKPVWFDGKGLSGIVKETREDDFTLSSTGPHGREVTAVISYESVLKIEHQSGFQKVFKNIARYSLGAAVMPVFMAAVLLGIYSDC